MKSTPVEQLFYEFDETAQILQSELSCTYLDALGETGENFFQGKVLQDEISGSIEEKVSEALSQIFHQRNMRR